MSRIVEPVVCCLGDSVVGNPTQFVMERLAVDAKIDWRFVTAVVPIQRVQAAVEGIRAMNFEGIAFLQSIPTQTLSQMGSISESAICTQRITTARRDGINWLAENLDGVALAQLLETEIAENAKPEAKIVVYGDASISTLLRLAKPNLADQILLVSSEPTPVETTDTSMSQSDAVAAPAETTASQVHYRSRHDLANHPIEIKALITTGELSNLDLSLLRCCKFSDSTPAICLSSTSAKPSDQSTFNKLRWLDDVDLSAARLAANFQFWTGYSPNLSLVKDCLDEYSQW